MLSGFSSAIVIAYSAGILYNDLLLVQRHIGGVRVTATILLYRFSIINRIIGFAALCRQFADARFSRSRHGR